MEKDEISGYVNSYPTKYTQGFLHDEIKDVLTMFPSINIEKFNDALFGNTCMLTDDGIIIYHCDIKTALRCGIENRNIKLSEWD